MFRVGRGSCRFKASTGKGCTEDFTSQLQTGQAELFIFFFFPLYCHALFSSTLWQMGGEVLKAAKNASSPAPLGEQHHRRNELSPSCLPPPASPPPHNPGSSAIIFISLLITLIILLSIKLIKLEFTVH